MSRFAKGATANTGDATITTGAATANMTDAVSDTKEELFPLVLAVGKSAESIFLVPGENQLDYFRKEGIHYVPKLIWKILFSFQ